MMLKQGFIFNKENFGKQLGLPNGYSVNRFWHDQYSDSLIIVVVGPTGYRMDWSLELKDTKFETMLDTINRQREE